MTVKDLLVSALVERSENEKNIKELLDKYLEEYYNDYDRYSILVYYYIQKEDYKKSLDCAMTSLKINPYSVEAHYNVGEASFLSGDFNNAILHFLCAKSICEKRNKSLLDIESLNAEIEECITRISEEEYSVAKKKVEYAINNSFRKIMSLAGNVYKDSQGNSAYIGVYNNWAREYCGGIEYPDNYVYEMYWMESVGCSKKYNMKGNYIVPIIGRGSNTDNNWIRIDEKRKNTSVTMPIIKQNSYTYLRLCNETAIASVDPVVFTKPIKLQHTNKKKLVFNIFIDSFNYRILELTGKGNSLNGLKTLMPNTYKAFSKGSICTNAYSDSEWTTPSLSSYWTGLYSHNHMNVDENIWWSFRNDIKLLPEYFNECGYMTCRLGENQESSNLAQGYMRGFDRFVSVQGHNDIGSFISDSIEQLEAFSESDQFVVLQLEDLHKIAGGFESGLSIQTHSPVCYREIDNEGTTTVKQGRSKNKQHFLEKELNRIDRYLGMLYTYIEENYNEDEYVLSLFSDHGTAFMVDNNQPMICEQRTHIPMLFYSNEFKGVCDEFIQNVDYVAILCKLAGIEFNGEGLDANLPVYFGGSKCREYVLSQSIYIGDPYQAMIKEGNKTYYYKTKNIVDEECRIPSLEYEEWMLDDKGKNVGSVIIPSKYREIIENNISHLFRR